jgi:hypothetical protein
MEDKEFFWRGSYKESHDKLVSDYLWDYYQSRSVAGKALVAFTKGGMYGYYDQQDYEAAIRTSLSIDECTFENNLIFRDLAEEAIDNSFSALPYVSRLAQKAGERNRTKERIFRSLQERHGRITRRVYELVPCFWLNCMNDANAEFNSRLTAVLRYFLTETGVCIKALRVNPGLVSSVERRLNAHALNPELHLNWIRSKILGTACIDPNLFSSKAGLVRLEDLLLHPQTEVFSCGLTKGEYEVIRTDAPSDPGDWDRDYIINNDAIQRLLDERSRYTLLLIAKPPLNSLI